MRESNFEEELVHSCPDTRTSEWSSFFFQVVSKTNAYFYWQRGEIQCRVRPQVEAFQNKGLRMRQ